MPGLVESSPWETTNTKYQKTVKINDDAPAVRFPLVLTPTQACGDVNDAIQMAKTLSPKASDGLQDSKLRKLMDANGGAIHLKSLGLRSAEDFSQFLDALAGEGEKRLVPHQPIGMHVLRRPQAKNVFTVNEYVPRFFSSRSSQC